MAENPASLVLPAQEFASFAELRSAHGAAAAANRSEPADASEIRAFLAGAQATGAYIRAPDERTSAQNILDYWFVKLIGAAPDELATLPPPVLAPASPGKADPAAANSPQPQSEYTADLSERIRLAAAARLWRDSGKRPGYLLFGKALENARHFAADDRDINALVIASDARSGSKRRIMIGVLALVVIVLVVLASYFWWLATQKQEALRLSEISREALADETSAAVTAQVNLRQRLEEARQSTQAIQAQLEQTRREFDAALSFINAQRAAGRITDIPPTLDRALATRGSTATGVTEATLREQSGFNSHFLGQELELPRGGPPGRQNALPYANFSLVLAPERRIAFLAASVVDRGQLRVLPAVTPRLAPDPRVPPDAQPPPNWFGAGHQGQLGPAPLVTGQEIAWGPIAQGDPGEASSRLTDLVNLLPNITPQSETFNRDVWTPLGGWVLSDHNPQATRVVIFCGPVLREDDPEVGGVKVPRQFWKIAVSGQAGGTLAVDAFLAPRDGPAAPLPFSPDSYRVSVAEIERVTALDFGPDLRSAGGNTAATSPAQAQADQLTAQIALMDAPEASQRLASTAALVNAFRDPALSEAEGNRLLAALLTMPNDPDHQPSRNGWFNRYLVLSEVPPRYWTESNRALLRRALLAFGAQVEQGGTALSPRLVRYIWILKYRAGLDARPQITVYLQFAGMAREKAVAISNDLKERGWNVPGEERTGAAAGRNEVRYREAADEPAAALLAEDLRAKGRTQIRAVLTPVVRPGTIEVWLSD